MSVTVKDATVTVAGGLTEPVQKTVEPREGESREDALVRTVVEAVDEQQKPFERPPLPESVVALRTEMATFAYAAPDYSIKESKPLERGWLHEQLVAFDAMTWQRWPYWYALQLWERDKPAAERRLPPNEGEWAHPQLVLGEPPFRNGKKYTGGTEGTMRVRKMLENALDAIDRYDDRNWHYLFDWFLYGVGALPDEPKEPNPGASERLRKCLEPNALQLWPADYFGTMLNERGHGRGRGFFVTPISLVEMMCAMTFMTKAGEDLRTFSTLDPAAGTGRFPLVASNYTLRLFAIDIDPLLVKAARVNAYLYCPWLAQPIGWLEAAYRKSEDETPRRDGERGFKAGLEVRDFFDMYEPGYMPEEPERFRKETPAQKAARTDDERLAALGLFSPAEAPRAASGAQRTRPPSAPPPEPKAPGLDPWEQIGLFT